MTSCHADHDPPATVPHTSLRWGLPHFLRRQGGMRCGGVDGRITVGGGYRAQDGGTPSFTVGISALSSTDKEVCGVIHGGDFRIILHRQGGMRCDEIVKPHRHSSSTP